jgi:DNA-binding response OmpR family regulator
MPDAPPKFLLIDDNTDSRFLLAKTLQRKFQGANILESQTSDRAVAFLSAERPDVVVAHRTQEADGLALVRMLRTLNSSVPIVMVSGIDRRAAALEAGANEFLHYDEWLRIGSVVSSLVKRTAAAPDVPDPDLN